MLSLETADVYYGNAQALHEVSISVAPGRITALTGRNGAGKTTLLRTLAGQLAYRNGRLRLDGRELTRVTPEAMSRAGVAYVPEDRQVFPTLTVEENLAVSTIAHRRSAWSPARVLDMFPRLAERRHAYGQALSGGEQQMLAIGRALVCGPSYLLLDEPTEGLAPIIVARLVEAIGEIAGDGAGVLLVEQNVRVPETLASEFAILDGGRIAWHGDRHALARDRTEIDRLLSL